MLVFVYRYEGRYNFYKCDECNIYVAEFFHLFLRQLHSYSSSALQPGVGFGLPFEGFVTMIVLRGGVVNPTPNPQLSWRTNVFCRGCLP
jgi:hypothetical protein